MPLSEIKYRDFCVRHVVSKNDLKKDQVIKIDDVCLKRTSNLKPITNIEDVIGKTINQDISSNKSIKVEQLNHET